MIDRESVHLLESPWTMLDFAVIVAVAVINAIVGFVQEGRAA